MRNISVAILGLAIGFLIGLVFDKCSPDKPVRVKTEVVTINDTIRDTVPEQVNRYIVRVDSVEVWVRDSVLVRDTVYVHIPIERKEYKTDNYFAIVEGYKPRLHYIETYEKTVYETKIERYKTKPRWGLGVQVGYGYNLNDKVHPYIGLGLQYNLLTW